MQQFSLFDYSYKRSDFTTVIGVDNPEGGSAHRQAGFGGCER